MKWILFTFFFWSLSAFSVVEFNDLKNTLNGRCKGLETKLRLQRYIKTGALAVTPDKAIRRYHLLDQGTDVTNQWLKEFGEAKEKKVEFNASADLLCLHDFYKASIKESYLRSTDIGKNNGCLDDKFIENFTNKEHLDSKGNKEWLSVFDFQNKPSKCSAQNWNSLALEIPSIFDYEKNINYVVRQNGIDVDKIMADAPLSLKSTQAQAVCATCLSPSGDETVASLQDQIEQIRKAGNERCCEIARKVHQSNQKRPLTDLGCQRLMHDDPSVFKIGTGCLAGLARQFIFSAVESSPLALFDSGNRAALGMLMSELTKGNFEVLTKMFDEMMKFYGQDIPDYYSCLSSGNRKIAYCEFAGNIAGMIAGGMISGGAVFKAMTAIKQGARFVGNSTRRLFGMAAKNSLISSAKKVGVFTALAATTATATAVGGKAHQFYEMGESGRRISLGILELRSAARWAAQGSQKPTEQ